MPPTKKTDTEPARSAQMALIRGKDTKPELVVRSYLHRAGLRYRLHVRGLPGRPDLVFPSRKAVVFVHGCFWHRHPDPSCPLARMPKTRLDFWKPKLEANALRDAANIEKLKRAGWRVEIIWECEIRNPDRLNVLAGQIRSVEMRKS